MKTSLIFLACLLAVAVAQRGGGRPGRRPLLGEWGGGVDNDNVDNDNVDNDNVDNVDNHNVDNVDNVDDVDICW